jgi:hypothetical protein
MVTVIVAIVVGSFVVAAAQRVDGLVVPAAT